MELNCSFEKSCRLFLCSPAAAFWFSATAALPAVHILTPECSADHRPCTPDPALHRDRLHRAVQGAGTAFHAGNRGRQDGSLSTGDKNTMRADLAAHAAVDAAILIVPERVHAITVKHQITPSQPSSPRRIPSRMPETAMTAMIGM
jgi:hypothetical protein